jgi:H+-transporting ATPase
VKLSLGAVVAADVRLAEGSVLLDQSMLTGESIPIEAGAGFQTYAGALVRRGEAVAEVTATGARTKFGRTAELVRTAHVVSSQQKAVLRVVRNLAMFNGVIIVILVAYAYWVHAMPLAKLFPRAHGGSGVDPGGAAGHFYPCGGGGARLWQTRTFFRRGSPPWTKRPSIDVLCADKTGTLTQNELTVTAVHPMPGFDEAHVLGLAALASSDGGQDPVDAPSAAAAARKPPPICRSGSKFVPFDPATKMSEATAVDPSGATVRIVKGAFAAVAGLRHPSPDALPRWRTNLKAQGLPRSGRRHRSASGAETCGNHRSQRPAPAGFRRADCGAAHVGRADRDGDRRCPGDGGNRGSRGGA